MTKVHQLLAARNINTCCFSKLNLSSKLRTVCERVPLTDELPTLKYPSAGLSDLILFLKYICIH